MVNNRIHYTEINFEIAVCNKDFSRANELEDELSKLYTSELMMHSRTIEELENIKETLRTARPDPQMPIIILNDTLKEVGMSVDEMKANYTKINQNWIKVQDIRKTYSDEKINANEPEIDQLRKIVIRSARMKDTYSVKLGLERLSLLYQNKFILYSARLDDNLNDEETRKKLFSLMNEWRTMQQLYNNFES